MESVARAKLVRQQVHALQIAEGFVGSQVLFAMNELGVFDLLAGGPRSGSQLATALGVPLDPLQRLLNAGVTTGLLTRNNGQYANSDLASTVLVSGSPGYLGDWIRLLSRFSRIWIQLKESVVTGNGAQSPGLHLGDDPTYTSEFMRAMDNHARLWGGEVLDRLDFGGGLRLLDVGGGPGTYAMLFARRWHDLRVTIFDLPEVVKIAERNCVEAGIADRVTAKPGDYYRDELGEGYDVVFLSGVLHKESPETCVMILQKAHRALRPGGRVVVQAVFINEDRTSPRWPVMLSLNQFLLYGSGRSYTVRETIDQLTAAGFRNCVLQRMSLFNVNSLIVGEKP